MSDQGFAHAGGVYFHATAEPGIHFYEAGRLYLFHVNRAAVIEDGAMRSEAAALLQLAQDRQRDFADVERGQGAMAQADDRQPNVIAPIVFAAPQIPAALQHAQDVTR